MFCQQCGATCAEGAKVCETCGAILNKVDTAQPVNQTERPTIPAPNMPPMYQPVQQQPVNYVTYAAAPQQQQPVAPNGQPVKPPQPGNGFAIAGMICGIAGIVLCCYGFIPAILGIVFGVVAKKKGNTSGMATAGVVCGAIGLALAIVIILIYVVGIGCVVATDGYYY